MSLAPLSSGKVNPGIPAGPSESLAKPHAPLELQSQKASFRRFCDRAETEYLQKIARRDAWSSLGQWFFPALLLSILVIAYWIYRHKLEALLQGTDNPREFSTLIGFTLKFLAALLHLALVAYLFRLRRILSYLGHPADTARQKARQQRESAEEQASADKDSIDNPGFIHTSSATDQNPTDRCAIYRIQGLPHNVLSLVLTSRSGLRRYRWYYYLGQIPLTPLPEQRMALPLYVQKKSWDNLASFDLEKLQNVFPDRDWLALASECQRLKCQLRVDVVKVDYYDFHFYYLCAIDPVPLKIDNGIQPNKNPTDSQLPAELDVACQLIENKIIASCLEDYQLNQSHRHGF